jgi:GT2 family glycosyltransferase
VNIDVNAQQRPNELQASNLIPAADTANPGCSTSAKAALVSVVVVNWNGMDYLEECLASVRGQTYPWIELVVIDNGSTDGSREWLRTLPPQDCRLIEFPTNTGFAAGVNAGIKTSRGEYIALLNNDAVADPMWLEHLVASFSNPSVGMAASKILFYENRDVIDKTGHLFFPDGLNRGRGAGEPDHGQYDQAGEVFFPDGCAALYRKKMLDDVGLFDEQFFAYGDDADLGLRGRWRGWTCSYSPDARVFHRHSRSLGKYSPAKALLVERNRFWVAVKLLPLPLLIASPALTLWRFFWHTVSIFSRRGLAGGVAREHSAWSLFCSMIRAYISAVAGLRAILKKRREVFRHRKISSAEFYALLRRYRISARQLAFRD